MSSILIYVIHNAIIIYLFLAKLCHDDQFYKKRVVKSVTRKQTRITILLLSPIITCHLLIKNMN